MAKQMLNDAQIDVSNYIIKNVTKDGGNLVELLYEIEDWFQSVPEEVSESYKSLSYIQRVALIHAVTDIILMKSEGEDA